MTYQGHKNRNHWNVSLWLFNDEGLYNLMREISRENKRLDDAVDALLALLPERTPDGVRFSKSGVRAAVKEVREE